MNCKSLDNYAFAKITKKKSFSCWLKSKVKASRTPSKQWWKNRSDTDGRKGWNFLFSQKKSSRQWVESTLQSINKHRSFLNAVQTLIYSKLKTAILRNHPSAARKPLKNATSLKGLSQKKNSLHVLLFSVRRLMEKLRPLMLSHFAHHLRQRVSAQRSLISSMGD